MIKRHDWTALIADLKPYAKNARLHSPEQVAQLAASIKEFGFTNPILIDREMRILAGHGRVEAAKSLGWPAVPAVMLEGLTEAQKTALTIADNKLALNASWDLNLLTSDLAGLMDLKFDMNLLGFSPAEMADMFPNVGAVAMPVLKSDPTNH